jgi:hypothetical protein
MVCRWEKIRTLHLVLERKSLTDGIVHDIGCKI